MTRPVEATVHPRYRVAFTLVELLVVIGVIGILIGLLLPAVSRVREAANRTRCANNLQQIGLAVQHHQAVLSVVPTVGWYDIRGRVYTVYYFDTHTAIELKPVLLTQGITVGPKAQLAGWGYQLLPFLEQQGLYDGSNCRGMFHPPDDQRAQIDLRLRGVFNTLSTALSVYRCPSRGDSRIHDLFVEPFERLHPIYRSVEIWIHDKRQPLSVAQTDYAANGGIGIADVNGPFSYVHEGNYESRARIKSLESIVDGLSNTVVFGEKLINRDYTNGPQADDAYGWASSYTPSTVRWCGGPAPAPFLTPKHDFRGPKGVDAGGRFGSAHPGGALFAFADGSVRPVSYHVQGEVFYALCVINDRGIIRESDY